MIVNHVIRREQQPDVCVSILNYLLINPIELFPI